MVKVTRKNVKGQLDSQCEPKALDGRSITLELGCKLDIYTNIMYLIDGAMVNAAGGDPVSLLSKASKQPGGDGERLFDMGVVSQPVAGCLLFSVHNDVSDKSTEWLLLLVTPPETVNMSTHRATVSKFYEALCGVIHPDSRDWSMLSRVSADWYGEAATQDRPRLRLGAVNESNDVRGIMHALAYAGTSYDLNKAITSSSLETPNTGKLMTCIAPEKMPSKALVAAVNKLAASINASEDDKAMLMQTVTWPLVYASLSAVRPVVENALVEAVSNAIVVRG